MEKYFSSHSFFCTKETIRSRKIFAAKQANIWNFGFGQHLNFNSGIPVFEPGSNIYATKEFASYSPKNGNLLSAKVTSTSSFSGQNNGTASVNASEESGSLTYLCSNAAKGLYNIGPAEGIYTVVITYQNGY
ncbi:MAG: hypothetical protein ACK5CO_06340 [Bacteroidota bacterium]